MSFEADSDSNQIARHAMHRILDRERTGTVEGVEFDLVHPDIDPEHWHVTWGFAGTPLIFPWDDEYVERSADIVQPDEDKPDPNEGVSWWLETHDLSTPVFVHVGDKVEILQVRRFHRGGLRSLDDPHDVTEHWVTFQIKRSNGARQVVPGNVSFVARDAIGPYTHDMMYMDDSYEAWIDDFKISLDKIGHRINRLEGDARTRGEWMSLAASLLSGIQEGIRDEDSPHFSVPELVEAAAIMGYALAKAEGEMKLEPLAMAELKSQEQRARAAKAGAMSRTKSDTPALKLAAAEMCRTDSNLSLNKCCSVLAEQFGREPANVRRLVKHLFERRDIPNGRVEYRPIREG